VQPLPGRVGEKIAHGGKYAAAVATGEVEDYSQPVLPGEGASDYERYLRTDELLALQKRPAEQVHRDELLFQTVHQASELWLQLAWTEAAEATRLIEHGDLAAAERLLRRSILSLDYVVRQLDMLEEMSPWEYQDVRKVLGHGSGFDSPGFREIRRVTPPLGQAFSARLREAGLSVVELYRRGREHEDLYRLAELLIGWDERIALWRMRHYLVVARIIGDQVVGTQGTPVELLGSLIKQRFYPELWQARNRLTALANEVD
jgi:tryptophan 2,3-dioxygenase